MQAANPALAMEQATKTESTKVQKIWNVENRPPTSAWHPPSAADIVLPLLNNIPTALGEMSVL